MAGPFVKCYSGLIIATKFGRFKIFLISDRIMKPEFNRSFLLFFNSKWLLLALSIYPFAVEAKVHEFGPYLISVELAKTNILSKHDYSIAIAKGGLVLTRMTVASDSPRFSSYVTDMDENGLFELFVVIGTKKDSFHSFSWNGSELANLNISEKTLSGIDVSTQPGVYSVRANKLRKLLSTVGNRKIDPSLVKEYSYSAKQQGWLETRQQH